MSFGDRAIAFMVIVCLAYAILSNAMKIEDNKMRIYELRDKYKSEGKYE